MKNQEMNEEEWGRVLAAYGRGLSADMIQFQDAAGAWGVIWTVPPCSPTALERTARQAVLCRATRVRHIRRARLIPRVGFTIEVVVVTEAIPVVQAVREISSSYPISVSMVLQDDGVRALLNALSSRNDHDVPV